MKGAQDDDVRVKATVFNPLEPSLLLVRSCIEDGHQVSKRMCTNESTLYGNDRDVLVIR